MMVKQNKYKRVPLNIPPCKGYENEKNTDLLYLMIVTSVYMHASVLAPCIDLDRI
jgi:hypothetical protein